MLFRQLSFASNKIKHIPDEIQMLIHLEKFYAYSNIIVNVPEWLGKLPLTDVNLFNNQILKVPLALADLGGIAELNLAASRDPSPRLCDTRAPRFVVRRSRASRVVDRRAARRRNVQRAASRQQAARGAR